MIGICPCATTTRKGRTNEQDGGPLRPLSLLRPGFTSSAARPDVGGAKSCGVRSAQDFVLALRPQSHLCPQFQQRSAPKQGQHR